jgi:Immunoglobulin domain/NHL repeat
MKRWMKISLCWAAGGLIFLVASPTGLGINNPPCTTPVIEVQPASTAVLLGSTASFTVTATNGLNYRWSKYGTNLVNNGRISGVTTTNLIISNVNANDAGNYTVVIFNTCGHINSSNAVLTVTVIAPPVITTQPTNQTGVAGGTVTFSAAVSGTGPFTYQWQLNGTNLPNNNIITTVAGNGCEGYSGDGGAATNACLMYPGSVAVDAFGNLFIADAYNNVIRKVDTNGIITTVAGNGCAGYSGDGGAATNACLNWPGGVAVDAFGNLFIADTENNVISKVAANGIITTVAGTNGCAGYSGDGGAATNACLHWPASVAVDAFGNLFIADTENSVIRKVDTNGIITTVAGNGCEGYSGDGGAATNACLRYPGSVAVDAFGNLFIADTDNSVIRNVNTNGIITTVAGNNECMGYLGDGGAATDACLNQPGSVAVDAFGNLLIADTVNDVIRKVDTNGIITTVAGNNGCEGYSGDGGAATNACLCMPECVAVDASGDLFIADTANFLIRKVTVSSFTWYNVTANDAGNYTVIITSPYGSVTSSNAVLKVLMPPTITTQPAGQAVSGGRTATFTVGVSGSQPLFYQWWFNGTNILGATNASLTLANVQTTNAGSYAVLVSNAWGSTISSNAILVFRAPTVLSGSLTNYTFESDTTYYITNIQLYGVTTIEGGAIIKFASQPVAQMTLNGPLVCLTGPSDVAILTSKDDNSVGGTLSGSTGNPSNANSGTYLSAGIGQTNNYTFLRLAYAGTGIFGSGTVNVRDSQFVQCGTAVGCSAGGTVILMNNLFYRSAIANFATNLQSTLALSNNLVFGTTVNLPQPSSPVWHAFNNDFDTCTIINSTLTNGYNAYLNCNGRLYPTNAFDIVSAGSLAYQSGTLGNFYQPTNSPLIHKGSTTADQIGLYHYTVTTNQVVEGTNTVSIGFHYVATYAYGDPLDTNGDGIPDYLEDANGNGKVDSGEIGWNLQGDLGLKVLITRPGNNSIIP